MPATKKELTIGTVHFDYVGTNEDVEQFLLAAATDHLAKKIGCDSSDLSPTNNNTKKIRYNGGFSAE